MSIYRGVLRVDCPKCEHKTDDEVIKELSCLSPLSTVVYLRISFFLRLVSKRNFTLLAVLSAAYGKKDSWLRTVHDDLNRLSQVEERLEEYREASLVKWVDLMQRQSKNFMKVVTIAISRADVNEVRFWWPKVSSSGRWGDEIPAAVTTFTCEACGYECSTPQAYSWHMYDRHQQRHMLREYIHSTTCECCNRDFFQRERVCTHIISSSSKCREFYRLHGSKVCTDKLVKLEDEAYERTKSLMKKGRRRAYAAKPPERVYGPLRAEAVRLGVRHDTLLKVPPKKRKGEGEQ